MSPTQREFIALLESIFGEVLSARALSLQHVESAGVDGKTGEEILFAIYGSSSKRVQFVIADGELNALVGGAEAPLVLGPADGWTYIRTYLGPNVRSVRELLDGVPSSPRSSAEQGLGLVPLLE